MVNEPSHWVIADMAESWSWMSLFIKGSRSLYQCGWDRVIRPNKRWVPLATLKANTSTFRFAGENDSTAEFSKLPPARITQGRPVLPNLTDSVLPAHSVTFRFPV